MLPVSTTQLFFNWCSGGGGWSPIGSTRHCRHQWLIVPAPGDYDDGEIDGMTGRGSRSTRRKPAPMPLCPTQTPNAARTRTRAAVVGSQRLTAWAMARPTTQLIYMSVPTRNHVFQFDGWILRFHNSEMENVNISTGLLHLPERDMTENRRDSIFWDPYWNASVIMVVLVFMSLWLRPSINNYN
jgi:hypothetical protein